MARYHATVESRRSATETFGYLATFSNTLADTPGVAAALPGFRQVMRPILLSPEQDADTIVWLATAPQVSLAATGSGTTGAPGPNTRCRGRARQTPAPHASSHHLPRRPPRTHPKLAQAGRDSVAAARSSLRRGRDDRAAAA